MAPLTHDSVVARASARAPLSRTTSGIGLALGSALAFSLSGPLAKGLIDAGWTAGAAVTVRVLIAAAVLLVPAILTLRGRWSLLRRNAGLILAYGLLAVAGCQLAYFNAVDRMQVGVALLIEFMSPVVVLTWMWLRHQQRPSRLTVAGAATAVAGMVLVLDLVSGADLDGLGVVWAIGAMLGAASYWIISADDSSGLPGLVLAAGGLLSGGIVLLLAGLVGIVPFAVASNDVVLADTDLPWWLAIGGLGIVTAALAYVLGIAAVRRLGSRLAAFVGLSEAVLGVIMAWLLLGEAPRGVQLVGGALVLTGVIAVRLGEPRIAQEAPIPTAT
ncbi:EamA family transporter [Aeromicrobium sp. UC242_57]|uniref:EamA family transporter n=1 Tax=Aeromicrobium sp. UC242_57 TaxID=3374624 RepID=UPI0037AF8ABC